MPRNHQCIKLGNDTYGYVIDSDFHCSHGGWSGELTLNNDGSADVDVKFKVINYDTYELIKQIPEAYDR